MRWEVFNVERERNREAKERERADGGPPGSIIYGIV
jgi:hypothetical protein